MQKVYIVLYVSYDADYDISPTADIVGVYTTIEKAEKYINKQLCPHYYCCKEVTLNKEVYMDII